MSSRLAKAPIKNVAPIGLARIPGMVVAGVVESQGGERSGPSERLLAAARRERIAEACDGQSPAADACIAMFLWVPWNPVIKRKLAGRPLRGIVLAVRSRFGQNQSNS